MKDRPIAKLNARFRDITIRLFQKHGMIIIGFWETTIGDATTTELVYVLAFDNLAHCEQA
ncbi:MAG: NIPSNAP family protein [Candidatus Poribacteria bacterium]|nr:NIPSNAP family protein [Candidatus Poribacteria bacterium]MDP6746138.1 NIPSNAP family protein [Candidatus Poribacteria bacterium]MDP6997098.1 NIPSNAP family protein [Candidatus Poribacteria bacterium]